MNKAKILFPLLPIITRLPHRVSEVPYKIAYNYIRSYFNKRGIYATARNSYISKNIVFMISDLDVSLWIDQFDPLLAKDLKRQLRHIKSIFPWVGEFNLYITSDINKIAGMGNLYEVQRDPVLNDYIGGVLTQNPFSAAVYLTRMFLSDITQLKTSLNTRQKKWCYHLEHVGKEAPLKKISSLDELIDAIIKHFPAELQTKETRAFFESPPAHSKLDFIFRLDRSTISSTEDYPKLTEAEIKLLGANIRWECFGIYTQLLVLDDIKNTIKHLGALNQLAKHYGIEQIEAFISFLIERSLEYEL